MIAKTKKKISHHFHEILKSHKSPDAIAWGVAIGTFLSIMIPINWVTLLIGLFIILFFENISKVALFITLILWNPFTLIPIYLLSFKLGSLILGDIGGFHISYILSFWKVSNIDYFIDFLERFFLGNLIVGAVFSVMIFFLVRKIAAVYQKNNKN